MVIIVSLNVHCQSGFVSPGLLTAPEGADMSSRIKRKETTDRLFLPNPIVDGRPVVRELSAWRKGKIRFTRAGLRLGQAKVGTAIKVLLRPFLLQPDPQAQLEISRAPWRFPNPGQPAR